MLNISKKVQIRFYSHGYIYSRILNVQFFPFREVTPIKADFNPFGISAKTTRKSIESWMLAAGVPPFKVYQRQGYDPETSLYHYQGLSFMDLEMDQIKKRLTKWGILRNDNR